jgi:hypothetical protein
MVADDPSRLRWLLGAGVLQLLERLCLQLDDAPDGLAASAEPAAAAEAPPLLALQHAGAGAAAEAHLQHSSCAGDQRSAPSASGSSAAMAPPLGVFPAARGGGGCGGEAAAQLQGLPLLLRQAGPGSDCGGGIGKDGLPPAAAAPSTGGAQSASAAAAQAQAEAAQAEAAQADAAASLLCVQRQAARLLALLALVPEAAQHLLASARWRQWLQAAADSSDCRLASSAARTLVHMHTAAALQRAQDQRWRWPQLLGRLAGKGRPGGGAQEQEQEEEEGGGAGPQGAAAAAADGLWGLAAGANPGEDEADAQLLAQRRLGGATLPVYLDGVHLLNPGAVQCWSQRDLAEASARGGGGSGNELVDLLRAALSGPGPGAGRARGDPWDLPPPAAEEGGAAGGEAGPQGGGAAVAGQGRRAALEGRGGADLPLVDVVFLHGIRGGPFVSWRREQARATGVAQRNLDHGSCWPSAWLAQDLPGARLLSVEYQAPVSAWEGGPQGLVPGMPRGWCGRRQACAGPPPPPGPRLSLEAFA